MYEKISYIFFIIILIIGVAYSPVTHAAWRGLNLDSMRDLIKRAIWIAENKLINSINSSISIVKDVIALVILSPFMITCKIADIGCNLVNPFLTDLSGGIPSGSGNNNPIALFPGTTSNTSLATFSYINSLPTCTTVTITGINAQGHNYAVVRDGNIIAEVPASQISYTDTNLSPRTNYQYRIRIPYPSDQVWVPSKCGGGGSGGPDFWRPSSWSRGSSSSSCSPGYWSGPPTRDSIPLDAYTKCLPQCGFGVDSVSTVSSGSTNLRWKCANNDSVADKGSCKIVDSNNISRAVDAIAGSLQVSPTADTDYVLTCANVDGPISIPQSISVFKPSFKEIKPY